MAIGLSLVGSRKLCQDISIAGEGKGIEGSRSGLWFEMWRIIRDLRPRFVIVENVPAITFRGMLRILGSLTRINYSAQGTVIRASDLGANHERKRYWLIAYPDDRGQRVQRLFPKEIQRVKAFSWCQDIRRIEDLRNRSDIPEPLIRRINDGISKNVDRLKCLGNSIVPQIAEILFRQIGQYDKA